MTLEIQLDVFIMNMGFDNNFSGLKEIGEIARKIIENGNDKLYSLALPIDDINTDFAGCQSYSRKSNSAINFF